MGQALKYFNTLLSAKPAELATLIKQYNPSLPAHEIKKLTEQYTNAKYFNLSGLIPGINLNNVFTALIQDLNSNPNTSTHKDLIGKPLIENLGKIYTNLVNEFSEKYPSGNLPPKVFNEFLDKNFNTAEENIKKSLDNIKFKNDEERKKLEEALHNEFAEASKILKQGYNLSIARPEINKLSKEEKLKPEDFLNTGAKATAVDHNPPEQSLIQKKAFSNNPDESIKTSGGTYTREINKDGNLVIHTTPAHFYSWSGDVVAGAIADEIEQNGWFNKEGKPREFNIDFKGPKLFGFSLDTGALGYFPAARLQEQLVEKLLAVAFKQGLTLEEFQERAPIIKVNRKRFDLNDKWFLELADEKSGASQVKITGLADETDVRDIAEKYPAEKRSIKSMVGGVPNFAGNYTVPPHQQKPEDKNKQEGQNKTIFKIASDQIEPNNSNPNNKR